MSNREQHRILCVTPFAAHHETLQSVLHSAKYRIASCMTVDQAIAFCISNRVAAIVLDSAFLTEQDWSAVQTFKSICSGVPILVLADNHDEKIPQEVDAVAKTAELILKKLQQLVDRHPPRSKSQSA
jgi:DNA-binding NtrC family response regulator